MANTALNRSEVLLLTNKSGGSVAQGDVVIIDSTSAASFTTTTTGAYAAGKIGVVIEPNGIASDAIGLVAFSGYVPKVTLSGAASLGDLFKTHTVAKQAVRHAAPAVAGDFGEVLGTGTTPAAILWGLPVGAAGVGSIGGSTGASDNAIIRADGVGGATVQNSLATVDDSGTVNIPTGQTYNINNSPHTHAGSTPAYVGCKAYNDATQAVNNTTAALTFNQEEFDTDGFHDTGSNTSRMTIPSGKDGTYLLQGGTFVDSVNSSWIGFKKGGTTMLRGSQSTGDVALYRSASAIVSLAAGDYVELFVATNGNTNCGHASAPDAQSWFAVTLLGS